MQNDEVIKQSANERQFLKVAMECLQYWARQRVALRGNNEEQTGGGVGWGCQ